MGTTINARSKAHSHLRALASICGCGPKSRPCWCKPRGLQQVKLTEFMIKAAQVAAEMALADRSRFVLPAGKWRGPYAALDAPPRAIRELRRQMSFT